MFYSTSTTTTWDRLCFLSVSGFFVFFIPTQIYMVLCVFSYQFFWIDMVWVRFRNIIFFWQLNTFSFDTKLRSDFDIVYLPNFLSKRFCSRILSREIFHFLNCFPLLFFRFFCRRRRFFCKKEKKAELKTMLLSYNFYIITAQSFFVDITWKG